jgi:hypothetical protein
MVCRSCCDALLGSLGKSRENCVLPVHDVNVQKMSALESHVNGGHEVYSSFFRDRALARFSLRGKEGTSEVYSSGLPSRAHPCDPIECCRNSY